MSIRGFVTVAIVPSVLSACGPGWERSADTESRPVHLAPGESTSAKVDADASQALRIDLYVDQLVGPAGELGIEMSDTRPSCNRSVRYTNDDGVWRSSRPNEHADRDRIRLLDVCASPERKGQVSLTFTNPGGAALDFTWHAQARITGTSGDAPDGSYVNITNAD